jgi:hypothetical protein
LISFDGLPIARKTYGSLKNPFIKKVKLYSPVLRDFLSDINTSGYFEYWDFLVELKIAKKYKLSKCAILLFSADVGWTYLLVTANLSPTEGKVRWPVEKAK